MFLTAGYMVAHGDSPYVPADVSGVFGKQLFPDPVPGIGYPPPWSLVLALAYLLSYNVFPNLILYNTAVKVPIIAVNILLALLIGKIVLLERPDHELSNSATCFMLFNPFVIYTTTIWSQFDTASVLLMLLSILALVRGRPYLSALALGSAIALKVIPVVLLPLLLLSERRRAGWFVALRYLALAGATVGLSFSPFLLGWSVEPIIDNWNVHFTRIGGFSPMGLLLSLGIGAPTGPLVFLGYLWIPALALVYFFVSRRSTRRPSDLILLALPIVLTLSLTRSWVSEQNLNFLLPLVLLVSIDRIFSKRWVTATWALPLVFGVLHTPPAKMLFLVAPESLLCPPRLEQLLNSIGSVGRPLILLTWLVIGLVLVKKTLHEGRFSHTQTLTGSRPAFSDTVRAVSGV